MTSTFLTPIRYLIVLLISVLLVSGCSSSSDSSAPDSQSPVEVIDADQGGVITDDEMGESANDIDNATPSDITNGDLGESTDATDESTTAGSSDPIVAPEAESPTPLVTRVDFDITVPAFMSDTLQVRLVWGDIETTAIWNNDELWKASLDFPVNTTNQLVVTFSDRNGAITLGSIERSFTTGANETESLQLSANEFDTERWDSDRDGVSNLSESIARTNLQASLDLVQDKTFRISWHQLEDARLYRVLENPDGISGFTDISGDLDATTTIFDHNVALYARVNAEYLVQSCNDQGCVDSELVMVTGTLSRAIGYFKASNTDENDFFGSDVSLSADGSTLAVGASFEDSAVTGFNGDQNDNSGDNAGAVYVFVRHGKAWQQQAYVKANNTNRADKFGGVVSLSADGNTLAVGAIDEGSTATGINGDQNDNSADKSGAVYVFVRSGETWQQQIYIKASNTERDDRFGGSVSLSTDGNTLAVGADRESSSATGINGDQNDNSSQGAGAVYVFVRNGDTWQQQAYIKASNTGDQDDHDGFGDSVSLSADGTTLAVGAEQEDSASTGINGDQNDNSSQAAGAVYVFVRNGEAWQQQAYIKASAVFAFDLFGSDVSLSADGNTLAVAAPEDNGGASGINGDQSSIFANNSGAVYVYVRTDGLWQQQAYVKASNTDEFDFFGSAISLSADGNTLAIGAQEEGSAATGINGTQNNDFPAYPGGFPAGAVYVFARNGELWQQQAYVKASNTDISDPNGDFGSITELFDEFGSAVSLSGDGNTLAVGAGREDSASTGINGDQNDISESSSGAVYLY